MDLLSFLVGTPEFCLVRMFYFYFQVFFFDYTDFVMIIYHCLSFASFRNLMAKQDMSELGFSKESDTEASGENVVTGEDR